MFYRWIFLIITGFLFTAVPVSNFAYADFDKGLKAYYYEDFETALTEWLIDAKQGNMLAQYRIGFIYANGEGVPKNDIAAYMWFNLSAAQGDKEASKAMIALGEKMTTDQISEAQRLSSKWLEEHQ